MRWNIVEAAALRDRAKRRGDLRRECALDQVERAISAHRERLPGDAEVAVHLRGVEAAEEHRPCEVGDLARVDLAVQAGVDAVGYARADVVLYAADAGRDRGDHL